MPGRTNDVGKERWVAPHFQVGFIRVTQAGLLRLGPLVGKTVAVRGEPSTTAKPLRPDSALRNCPGAQMRGDWVEAKGGMRVQGPRPGLLGQVKLLRAARVKAVKLLWLDRRGAKMRVRVRNGLAVPLKGLTLHARYERCIGTKRKILPGKPMPASVTRSLGDLAPGKSQTLELPLVKTVLPKKFARTHALREVYLYSANKKALVDLSRGLPIGQDRRCR